MLSFCLSAWGYARVMLLDNTNKAFVGRCRPFDIHIIKTDPASMVHVRIADIKNLNERRITYSFRFKHVLENPCFMPVDHLSRRDWIYAISATVSEEFDAEVDS